jgi:hypothetical protein
MVLAKICRDLLYLEVNDPNFLYWFAFTNPLHARMCEYQIYISAHMYIYITHKYHTFSFFARRYSSDLWNPGQCQTTWMKSFVWFQRGVDFINYIDDVSLCSVKSKCPVSSPRTMPQQVDLRRGLTCVPPNIGWTMFFSPLEDHFPMRCPLLSLCSSNLAMYI